MTPRLPARLRAIAGLLPEPAAVVADIGAGHGALAAHLCLRGGLTVIATERSAGPLDELRRNLAAWGLAGLVDVRCGDGLAPLAQAEADVAVVAGMGARTTLAIVADARERGVRHLILQCMQRDDLVEPWLAGHGWAVRARAVCTQGGRRYHARRAEAAA